MTKFSTFAIAAAFVTGLGFASPASALDLSFEAMSQSGNHTFYVWCTGKDDYTETVSGANAKEAQAALAAKAGKNCWPVWQGLEG